MKGLPAVEEQHGHDDWLELKLRVDAHCPWFEGHFPGQPILPGVVQIGWAAWFAARWTGHEVPPTLLTRIKFKRPVRPGARLTLRLQNRAGKLSFEFLADTPEGPASVSSGSFAVADVAS